MAQIVYYRGYVIRTLSIYFRERAFVGLHNQLRAYGFDHNGYDSIDKAKKAIDDMIELCKVK